MRMNPGNDVGQILHDGVELRLELSGGFQQPAAAAAAAAAADAMPTPLTPPGADNSAAG